MNSFTSALSDRMNTLGTGRPWKFSHFRKTDGYAAMPLDGVWLREQRPAVFWRAYNVYDYDDVGFVSSGPQAEPI